MRGRQLFVGLLYAAISIYWGLGGSWLLNTVSRSLGARGYAGDTIALVAVWAAVVLKALAAWLPLRVVHPRGTPKRNRLIRVMTWIEAGILTIYGFVLTGVGLLVQAHVIHASATADHRALAWHAYLWDPWFLIWGLLVVGALRATAEVGRQGVGAVQHA